MTLDQFVEELANRHSGHVINTFLQEFGYVHLEASAKLPALKIAAAERGSRLSKELRIHGQRLADRAQMGRQQVQGSASVIR